MKLCNFTILLIVLSYLFSCSSNHSFNSFYSENKKDIQVHVNAPKWLTMLFIPSEDKADVKRFSKGIKKIKLMMTEKDPASLSKSLDHFTKSNGYTPYIYMRDSEEQINLMAKHDGDYIREIVLKYDGGSETVIVGLLGKMHKSTFEAALKRASETD